MVAYHAAMIKISKKADYAVLVMAALARRQRQQEGVASGSHTNNASQNPRSQEGSPDTAPDAETATATSGDFAPTSAQELADEIGLSRPLIANILKALTQAQLLDSVRGAGGGYLLAKPIASINLAQIIGALEGPIRIVDCAHGPDTASSDCSISDHCPSRGAMQVVHHRIAALMADIHLPELLRLENRTTPSF